MTIYEQQKDYLHKLFDMLEAHFGPEVEFVLHDLTKEYEHTIVDIRNGHITGREIGGTGDILGLRYLSGESPEETYYNCLEYTKDGKALRSSTLFLRDEKGDPAIAIAINEDVTKTLEIENYLHSKSRFSNPSDYVRGDVNEMLQHLMFEAQLQVGKSLDEMSRADKIEYIRYLDTHGAFLITYSNVKVCEALNISNFTLYSYLKMIRGEETSGQ